VFRLEESNFSPWPTDGPEAEADYDMHVPLFLDRLRDGWTPEGVVWEIALREGLPLSSSVEVLSVNEKTVHRVVDRTRDQQIHVCLDESVPASVPRALGLGPDDLFVCRDCALTDEVAANLALECRLKTV
jgi:adenine-specific DNA-methyltransferase